MPALERARALAATAASDVAAVVEAPLTLATLAEVVAGAA